MSNAPLTPAAACTRAAEHFADKAALWPKTSRLRKEAEGYVAPLAEAARLLTTYAGEIEAAQACEADRAAAVATLERAREAMTHHVS